jgi:HEAT repeat protein
VELRDAMRNEIPPSIELLNNKESSLRVAAVFALGTLAKHVL